MLPVLATVTYGAAVIALFGFTSLLLDVDVIDQKDAGPLIGPIMVLASCVVVLLALLRVRGRASLVGPAAAAAASVYAVMLVVGAVAYATVRADLTWLVLFVGAYALSPFVWGPAVLAGVAVVVVWAGTRRA
jgi:hypothetical protein